MALKKLPFVADGVENSHFLIRVDTYYRKCETMSMGNSQNRKKGSETLAKKPKEQWQIDVRCELDRRGLGYKELAEEMGENEGNIRQAMCKNNQPLLRDRILNYLDIE